MKLFIRIIIIVSLAVCLKYIPVFEPRGINYFISLISLIILGLEIKKLWKSINFNPIKKNKIQTIGYITLISLIFIYVILIMHKEFPSGNIRYIRGLILIIIISLGGKITSFFINTRLPNWIKNSVLITFSTISFIVIIEFDFSIL